MTSDPFGDKVDPLVKSMRKAAQLGSVERAYADGYAAAQHEIVRLRAELAIARQSDTDYRAHIENARLRSALEEIAGHLIDSELASREKRGMARKALKMTVDDLDFVIGSEKRLRAALEIALQLERALSEYLADPEWKPLRGHIERARNDVARMAKALANEEDFAIAKTRMNEPDGLTHEELKKKYGLCQ